MASRNLRLRRTSEGFASDNDDCLLCLLRFCFHARCWFSKQKLHCNVIRKEVVKRDWLRVKLGQER